MATNILRTMSPRDFVEAVVGIAVGLTLSVIPVIVVVPLTVASLLVLFIRVRILNRRSHAVLALTVCIVLAVCYFLPVKHLDVKVGPIAYEDLTLSELCDRLYVDYGVICHVPDRSGETCRLSFVTNQVLSRKEVLEKLSAETKRPLHIGFCGTNATILFGACPSFSYLGERRPSSCPGPATLDGKGPGGPG